MKSIYNQGLILFFSLLLAGNLTGQNLVLNPSFETVNTGSLQCSWYTTRAQFSNAISNWDLPTDGSTDIFHTSLATSCYCSPFSTHASANGPQAPRTGNAMTAIVTYGSGGCSPYREYIQGELSTPLVAGTTYEISMYVSLGDYGTRATNNIGVKFTTTRQNTGSMCVWNTTPDVNYSGAPITNETGWTLLTFTYTPSATNLRYFTIGNFYNDASTSTTVVSGSKSTIRYYIDDVSVVNACNITANAGSNKTTTCSTPSVTLNGSSSGGASPVSYSWSPSTGLSSTTSATPTANPSSNTTYTLTVTDNNGCTDTDQVTVTVNKTAPTANAGSNKTTTCTSPTTTLNGSGGGSYSWSPSTGLSSTTSASPTANPGSTTTYTLTVTAANGCIDTDQATVTVNKTPPTANAGSNKTTTCTSPTTTLNGSGGTSYSWSPSTGLSSTTSANPTANPGSTTTYTLTATASNGCTDTDQVTVTVNKTPPTANAGSNQTTTCTSPTTTLNGSGGTSYSWSPSTGLSSTTSANPTANPSSTTTYTLTATAANGCTDTDQVTVTVDETPPTANAGSNQTTTCSTPSVTLNGSGGATYSWSPGSGLSSTTSASPTANPGSTATYTLTVTGTNGCTDTDQVTVTVDKTPPTANAGSDKTTTCTAPSTTLNGSGGASYSWSPTTGLSSATSATPTANPSSTTTYTLTATAANGCTDTDQVTVTVNKATPTANAGSDATTTCNTPTTTLSGSGGVSYSWSPSAGLSSSTSASPTANPSTTTTYTLTATAANGCTDTDQVTITVDETAPTANAGSDVTTNCISTTATLTGSGGSSYLWSPSTGLSSTNTASTTANPSTTTTYTLTTTAANGCSNTDQVIVTVDKTPPTANAGSDVTNDCTSPTATMNASGGSSYSWLPSTGLSSTTIANPTANPTSTTTYTVTVTGSNGCTDTDQVTVTVDKVNPTADAGVDATTNCNTPTTTLSGSGGGTYLWSPSIGLSSATSATPSADPSITTTYTLTVTSANGCTDTDDVIITVDETAPTANAGSDAVINCYSINGEEILDGSSSTTGMDYSWTTGTGSIVSGVNSNTLIVDGPGTYTLTVLNTSNGCSDSDNAIVTEDLATPTANAGSDATVDCTTPSTTLNGTGGVSYSWSPTIALSNSNIANPIASPTSNTTYTLTVTAANGCTDTDDVTVLYDGIPPGVNAGSDFTTTCTTPNTTLNGSGDVGVTFSWSPSTGLSDPNINNPIADPSITTTYTLTVTAPNGCTNFDEVIITVDETDPTVSAGNDITIDCNTTTATAVANGADTYTWNTPDGSFTGSSLNIDNSWTAGTLTVTGTTANGCNNSDAFILTIDTIHPVADAGLDQTSTCASPIVTLDGSNSTGNAITYAWTGGNIISGTTASTATSSTPATYTLTVTSPNGCFDSDEVIIIPDSNIPTADAGGDATLTCSVTSLNVGGSNTSTGADMSYSWTTVNGNITAGNSSDIATIDLDGQYALTVLDTGNGCSSSDTVTIFIDTVTPIASLSQDSFILNCAILTASPDASLSSGSNNGYSWATLDGNIVAGANSATPTFDLPGTYELTVTSDNDCENLNSAVVTVTIDTLTPSLTLVKSGDFDCDTDTVNLSSVVDTNVTYIWSGPDIISTDSLSYATANTIGVYELTITNPDNGCTNSDTIGVYNICELEVVIPNIFSPNGDGINDIFRVTASNLSELKGVVMNRWGQTIFEWNTYEGGWDGYSLSGTESAAGTYYFIITYTDASGETYTETGPLQLVR